MTERFRIAITSATALLLGANAYSEASGAGLSSVPYGGIIYGLAVCGVFLVHRWWALLPAIAPVAVTVYLHNMTDYVSPWHEDSWGFSDNPAFYVLLVIAAIILQAAFLSLGLLLHSAWVWLDSRRGDSAAT